MDYIFRSHYRLTPEPMEKTLPIVLLAESEPEACAMYHRHLTAAPGLDVMVCTNLLNLGEHLRVLRPDVLIINPTPNLKASLGFLGQVKQLYPALLIITLGYSIPDDYLDQFMRLGVSVHINRQLSRPQDIALAVRQVLNN